MSTRATYQLPNANDGLTTFYIHHDGYPEGAAEYFQNLLKADGKGLAERFIRGNDNAEITRSHDFHGDTEYRYTLNVVGDLRTGGRTLMVQADKRMAWSGPNQWKTFAHVPVDNFIRDFDRSNPRHHGH